MNDSGRSPGRILVVGLGNPDRGDDGVGARVIAALADRLPDDVTLLARRGDMVSLIDDWAGFDALICVDAAAPMGTPGRIHRIDLATDDLPVLGASMSSHAMGLAEVVGLARALRLAPRDIIVYAVEGESFEGGAPVGPAVAGAVAPLADRVAAEVLRLSRSEAEVAADA
jgi:hydrogenase maturation protease